MEKGKGINDITDLDALGGDKAVKPVAPTVSGSPSEQPGLQTPAEDLYEEKVPDLEDLDIAGNSSGGKKKDGDKADVSDVSQGRGV